MEDLTYADVDRQKGTLRFAHVKNKPEHDAVLSERAVAKLRERRAYCMTRPRWKGESTPIVAGRKGEPLTTNTISRHLKQAAARLGRMDRMTSRVVRKSPGTLKARQSQRHAREQLGITAKVFEKHDDPPTVEDRLERREVVPTVEEGPDAIVGRAFMDLQAQRSRTRSSTTAWSARSGCGSQLGPGGTRRTGATSYLSKSRAPW